MATYLIDYENVYIEGLTGLERLSQRDEVVIFYTQNRCGLTFELHQRLISCKAKLRLMEVTALSTRKNTVKMILEGFLVFQVTKAGYTSLTAVCLAPKPPPMRGLETRTMDLGMCRALAMLRRAWNTIWVELSTFSRP